jgi:hypothetical protein
MSHSEQPHKPSSNPDIETAESSFWEGKNQTDEELDSWLGLGPRDPGGTTSSRPHSDIPEEEEFRQKDPGGSELGTSGSSVAESVPQAGASDSQPVAEISRALLDLEHLESTLGELRGPDEPPLAPPSMAEPPKPSAATADSDAALDAALEPLHAERKSRRMSQPRSGPEPGSRSSSDAAGSPARPLESSPASDAPLPSSALPQAEEVRDTPPDPFPPALLDEERSSPEALGTPTPSAEPMPTITAAGERGAPSTSPPSSPSLERRGISASPIVRASAVPKSERTTGRPQPASTPSHQPPPNRSQPPSAPAAQPASPGIPPPPPGTSSQPAHALPEPPPPLLVPPLRAAVLAHSSPIPPPPPAAPSLPAHALPQPASLPALPLPLTPGAQPASLPIPPPPPAASSQPASLPVPPLPPSPLAQPPSLSVPPAPLPMPVAQVAPLPPLPPLLVPPPPPASQPGRGSGSESARPAGSRRALRPMVSASTKPITVFTTTLNKGRDLPEQAEPSVVVEGSELRHNSSPLPSPLQAQPLREDLKETRREPRRAFPHAAEEPLAILRAPIHHENPLGRSPALNHGNRPGVRSAEDPSIAERRVAELLARQKRNHRLILGAATLGLLGVVAVLILSQHEPQRAPPAGSELSTARPSRVSAPPSSSDTSGAESPDTDVISVSDLASAAPEPSDLGRPSGRRLGPQRSHAMPQRGPR